MAYPAMRIPLVAVSALFASALGAQTGGLHTATQATEVQPAPVAGSTPVAALGQIAKGTTVEVIARDRGWVRVRLEGWVMESDLLVADSTFRPLSAADIRSDPASARGKLVRWEVEAVALRTGDGLRPGLVRGENYLLALGPGNEKALLYIAVPPPLLAAARELSALAPVTVTARIRNGRSQPTGVPILDLQSLTRR